MGSVAESAAARPSVTDNGALSKFRLDGKVAIVTGVGPAMGREFALALADAGADVCVAARSRSVIDEVADEMLQLHAEAGYLEASSAASTSSATTPPDATRGGRSSTWTTPTGTR